MHDIMMWCKYHAEFVFIGMIIVGAFIVLIVGEIHARKFKERARKTALGLPDRDT